MTLKKVRNRLAAASAMAVAAATVMLTVSGGVASAITVPAYPTVGVYPNWLTAGTGGTGTQSASNIVRGAGSDTTIFMMQQLGDLFSQAGLYGCQLIGSGAGQNADCDNTTGTSPNYSDIPTTDTVDNFDRTEVLQGVNAVGSGNGQKQLCGAAPTPDAVDFARSSKPASSSNGCNDMVELGYAKDGVPALDFQSVDPAAVGSATYYDGTTFTAPAQSFASPAFPSGGIGPVAAGWLPGDPTNCVAAGEGLEGTPCSGTPLNDIDNTPGSDSESVAFRLYCATDASRITDWGQLTNLSAANNGGTPQPVGYGKPIGVPVRMIGINTGSGTVATFASFANTGSTYGGGSGNPATCGSSSVLTDGNAASGPNPFTSDGVTGNQEISVENNASQIGDFAAADFPNDPADQAVELATSLYFESNGVNLSNPNAGTETLEPGTGTVPSGVPTAYVGTPLNENGVKLSIPNERSNTYPTARTLFNIYRTSTIRASTAGLLDWICDSNSAFHKGHDLTTGAPSFDSEITNIINNNFEFSRINDSTVELASNKVTPADGVAAPNSTCDASLAVTGNGTGTVTMTSGASVPSPQAFTTGQAVYQGNTELGTVQSVSGDQMTLSASVPTGATTIYFPGMAPVLGPLASPNS